MEPAWSMTTASSKQHLHDTSNAPNTVTRKLRAECHARTDKPFDAIEHLQNIFTIIHRTDPTAILVSKTPNHKFTSIDANPSNLHEFYRHFDVVYHKLQHHQSQFHIIFSIASVNSLQEWKSTTRFLQDIQEHDVWINEHYFHTPDVRTVGFFTQISPTFTHRQKLRNQLTSILKQVQRESSQSTTPTIPAVPADKLSTTNTHDRNSEEPSDPSTASDKFPIIEIVKTRLTIRPSPNNPTSLRTSVLTLRSDHHHVGK